MKIKEINISSRPREKMKRNGISTLSNEELLAILLRCGNKNKSAIELSYEILAKAGNIKNLFKLDYHELTKISGIKDSKASIILASIELAKRAMSYQEECIMYNNPKNVFSLIRPLVAFEKTEVFYALYLNSECRLIKYEKISTGNFLNVNMPRQKIYQDALKMSVCSVIISHNHPSGNPEPSDEDIEATIELKEGLEMLGIMLLDHIIIAGNKFYSFSDVGIL